MKSIIIGIGTGRCGTKSLAHLLNIQPDSNVTHEAGHLHWFPALGNYEPVWEELIDRKESVVGDVGYAWIQYLGRAHEDFDNLKVVYIWRDPDEVIESFWRRNRDRVEAWGSAHLWYLQYPFFGFPPSKAKIKNTILVYHELALEMLNKYSGYSLNMRDLNDRIKIGELLDFVGIPHTGRIPIPVIFNVGGQAEVDTWRPAEA